MAAGEVGSVSIRAEVSVAAAALVLPSTMVRVEVPPAGMAAGLNCLLMVGGLMIRTVSLAGSSLVTPVAVVSAPAGMVLR